MPDEVDEVVVLGDLASRPRATPGAPDDVEARVDPPDVLLEVRARDRSDHDVLVGQSFRDRLARRHVEFLDELAVLHLSPPRRRMKRMTSCGGQRWRRLS